jgi:hypothetical protein
MVGMINGVSLSRPGGAAPSVNHPQSGGTTSPTPMSTATTANKTAAAVAMAPSDRV